MRSHCSNSREWGDVMMREQVTPGRWPLTASSAIEIDQIERTRHRDRIENFLNPSVEQNYGIVCHISCNTEYVTSIYPLVVITLILSWFENTVWFCLWASNLPWNTHVCVYLYIVNIFISVLFILLFAIYCCHSCTDCFDFTLFWFIFIFSLHIYEPHA